MPRTPEPSARTGTTWCIATRITVYAVAATCAMLVAVIVISHWQFAQGLTHDRLLYLGDELNELRAAVSVYGPYTDTCFVSTRQTDIEYIVATSEAHDSGLCARDRATRARFASNLRNPRLPPCGGRP